MPYSCYSESLKRTYISVEKRHSRYIESEIGYNSMTTETLIQFLIWCVVMLLWMINTKKLYKRDYIVFGISSILAPLAALLTYQYVTSTLIGNEIQYMILVCLVTHMAINIIRRSARTDNKNNKSKYSRHNKSVSSFIKSWKALGCGIILFISSAYFMIQKLNDLSNILLIFANLLIIPSSINLTKKRMYKIDRLNMGYDLNCWGCRLIGILLMPVGFIVLIFGLGISFGFSSWLVPLFFVLAIEIILIGGFCEYRSFRRQGIFVWHGRMK